jgi:hypothetical protein
MNSIHSVGHSPSSHAGMIRHPNPTAVNGNTQKHKPIEPRPQANTGQDRTKALRMRRGGWNQPLRAFGRLEKSGLFRRAIFARIFWLGIAGRFGPEAAKALQERLCRTRCNPSLPPRPAAAHNPLPLPLRSGAEDSAGSARRPNAASPCRIRPQSPSASGRPADGSGSRRSKQPS